MGAKAGRASIALTCLLAAIACDRSDSHPPAVNDARCKHCSLQDSCLPSVVGEKIRLQRLEHALFVTTDSVSD